MKYNLGAALLGLALSFTTLTPVAHAQTSSEIVRSEDFNVFWPQLRTALLDADIDALDTLSLSTTGLPFGYDFVDLTNTCERQAVQAYLQAKLDYFYTRPGGQTIGEFLEETPNLDLASHPDVTQVGPDEYSLKLIMRFARNSVDNAWDLTDLVDGRDRVFSFSESVGGPASC